MLNRPVLVAVNLFRWASEQGFIGVAVYFACWVFMFPVMVLLCIAGAIFGWFIEESYEIDRRSVGVNEPRDGAELRKWEDEDRQFEEAKAKLLAQGGKNSD